ncbi:MAG: hypothetical protein KDK12_12445 [Rhodobacteraceae bacterium]|nr:hypothetical protein [Paracoccaceae bacterium]
MAGLVLFLGIGLAASGAQACPDWQLTGQQVTFSGAQLSAPQRLPVVAGGSDNLANCPLDVAGYVATRPDFDLTLTGMGSGRDLILQVDAECDSVLLVNDWSGRWSYNDDMEGSLNSRIVVTGAQDGVYDIWVGTYGPTPCQAALTLQVVGGGDPGCPAGQVAVNGTCQALPPQSCAEGQTLINGTCVSNPCPQGYSLVNGSCQAVAAQGCQPGQVSINGACMPDPCPQGYSFANGSCQPVVPQGCPAGQVMMNGACLPNPCPQGYAFANGACVPDGAAVTCPQGQVQIDGACQPEGTPTTCPAGQVLILGVCQDPGGRVVN